MPWPWRSRITPKRRTASLVDRLPVASLTGAALRRRQLASSSSGHCRALWWNVLGLNSRTVRRLRAAPGRRRRGGRRPACLRRAQAVGPATATGPARRHLRRRWRCCCSLAYIARWIGFSLEDWAYNARLFRRPSGRSIGVGDRWRAGPCPGCCSSWPRASSVCLGRVRGPGLVQRRAYKRSQGQKVRRGTMLGILLLGLSGIYSLHDHGTLNRGSRGLGNESALHGRGDQFRPTSWAILAPRWARNSTA